ncbi:hypothetical protein QBC39DRAFT_6437 [Podospora conica]|nr:hypothetical protein QBC39DRAFT_6437 [Schizothecium conicum]
MNGLAGAFPPPAAALWHEYRTPDGRVYYSNSVTKATQWTKPEEMMSPAERALANQPWKEYTAEGGRKYWYNTETKQSSWEMPDVYKRALGGDEASPITPATPAAPFSAHNGNQQNGYGGGGRDGGYDSYRDHREPLGESRQLTFGSNVQAQSFVPANVEPEYATQEEAEAAFVKLLRRSGVQPDWTWEQALRAIVKDPHFRAIKDPKDRKAAFEKYCHDVIVQDKERAKERLTKLRADFATMLKSHPEIKHYTRWKTARPMIEAETIFRSTNSESERRQLFDDYISDLKRTHKEQQVTMRKSAMDGLIELLPTLNLEPYTRWAEAQGTISSTPSFQTDEKYKTLSKYDILTVFQNHVKALERTFNDTKQQEKNRKARKERQNRDAFVALLKELRKDGKIKANTKWSQIYPSLENDSRYKAMAGQSGSTPMDLFWDMVEEEERALRGTRNQVLDVLGDKRFEVTPKTTFEEFEAAVKDDRRTANIQRDILELIFERLREKKGNRTEEDKHSERHQRRAAEDLRAYMKRLDPPVSVDDSYDQVKARLTQSDEYQAVSSDDARRGVYDKYIRRLREKNDEERERLLRRKDRGGDDGHRDRGERSRRTPARRSRTPDRERDVFEADRKRTNEVRERNFRKTSMAESLLSDRRSVDSPYDSVRDRDRERDRDRDRSRDRRDRDRRDHRDHRDRDRSRDRRDRERDYDRRPPRHRDHDDFNHYDRERRTREEDRERFHNSRRRVTVDRDVDELPYGDERPASSSQRRPRADEDNGGRSSKRAKLDDTTPREPTPLREAARQGTRTPQQQVTKKEKEASLPPPPQSVRAGSEEGEIEED